MKREEFRFFHRLRVRWAECDAQAIVFNGHYLTFFDVATTEYWRNLQLPYPSAFLALGVDLFVVKAIVEYHAAARYDDELDVGVRIVRLGRSSVQVRLAIFRSDEHLISGDLTYVNTDSESRKSIPIPHSLRHRIAAFEGIDADPA
jgi:acyl-CoA thioester hydrolase